MAKKETVLKSRDVAHILNLSPDDVTVLAQKGELKGFKTGRLWRFRQEDVVRYKELGKKGRPRGG